MTVKNKMPKVKSKPLGKSKKLPTGKAKKANLKGVNIARRIDIEGSDRGIDLTTFHGRFTHARYKSGLTQEQLGEVLGYTRQAMSAYTTGKNVPSIEQIELLAERMGVPASYLAFGEKVINGNIIKLEHDNPLANIAQYGWENGRFIKLSSFILPKDYAKELAGGDGYSNLGVYRLNFDADTNGIRKGDYAIINKARDRLSNQWKRWLVIFDKNPHIVSYIPSKGAGLKMVLGDGTEISMPSKDVTVVGAVVGSIIQS